MPLPTMHLCAPQGKRTCVVIRASLLSQVATRLLSSRPGRQSWS